jgi:hypothetical protein
LVEPACGNGVHNVVWPGHGHGLCKSNQMAVERILLEVRQTINQGIKGKTCHDQADATGIGAR